MLVTQKVSEVSTSCLRGLHGQGLEGLFMCMVCTPHYAMQYANNGWYLPSGATPETEHVNRAHQNNV